MSDCPNKAQHHEPGKPGGYIATQEWLAKMDKTHRQRRCPGCKLYVIWVKREATR